MKCPIYYFVISKMSIYENNESLKEKKTQQNYFFFKISYRPGYEVNDEENDEENAVKLKVSYSYTRKYMVLHYSGLQCKLCLNYA